MEGGKEIALAVGGTRSTACSLKGCLLRFEPQLLKQIPAVKIDPFRAKPYLPQAERRRRHEV